MAQVGRPGFSPEAKRDIWRRWKAGESLSDIGRALGKASASIFQVVMVHGGIPPASRCRFARQLSLMAREEISRGVAAGASLRSIAKQLGRSPSTISREVARHGNRSAYRAVAADERTYRNAKRPKACKLAGNATLRDAVAEKLTLDWSPEQISGWLRVQLPEEPRMQVSTETSYRSLFIQTRGVLKRELVKHLRSRRAIRRNKLASTGDERRGRIIDAVSIRDRPAAAEDRVLPGHWEGDLLSGSKNSHIATLVERHSRYVMIVRLDGKDTASVVRALSERVQQLPAGLMSSLTWDRGREMAGHRAFTMATDVQVYFCDPQSPWQRGTSENTNRLLRQYFPKRTDLSLFSQDELDAVALRLNQRPRKTLRFQTPADILWHTVASFS